MNTHANCTKPVHRHMPSSTSNLCIRICLLAVNSRLPTKATHQPASSTTMCFRDRESRSTSQTTSGPPPARVIIIPEEKDETPHSALCKRFNQLYPRETSYVERQELQRGLQYIFQRDYGTLDYGIRVRLIVRIVQNQSGLTLPRHNRIAGRSGHLGSFLG